MSAVPRLAVAAVAVAALIAGAVWMSRPGEPAAIATATTEATETATETVARRTLQHAEEFEGSLGYGDSFTLPGQVSGTVTWVPEEGAVLEPGDVLYRIDELPTYWAYGDVPMYRGLGSGSEGGDVEQLQRYLQAEGYLEDDVAIDGEYGAVTRAAVEAWQEDHGLDDTGRIDASQLLFLPYQAIRVATTPRVGESATGGVLEVTLSDLFVTLDVSARSRAAFEDDPAIEVEMADGTRYGATVESITAKQSQDALGEQQYRVRLALSTGPSQEPGEVTVEVIDLLAEGALAVPVQALVALVEGGYAVEVVQADGATELRAVEVGEFADGWVAVTGDIAEGDRVVVPE